MRTDEVARPQIGRWASTRWVRWSTAARASDLNPGLTGRSPACQSCACTMSGRVPPSRVERPGCAAGPVGGEERERKVDGGCGTHDPIAHDGLRGGGRGVVVESQEAGHTALGDAQWPAGQVRR